MIQPGGAMALFVLRLAGLLSLEKSLKENSTSSYLANDTIIQPSYDLTDSSSLSPQTESSLLNLPKNVNGSSEIDVTIPKFSFLKSENDNGTLIRLGGNNSTEDNVFEKGREQEDKGLVKSDVRKDLKKLKNSNDKNESTSGKGNLEVDPIQVHRTTTEVPPPYVSELESDSMKLDSAEPSTLPPRSSETGFSPVFTYPINNTAIPFFAHSQAPPRRKQLSFTYGGSSSRNIKNFHEMEAPPTGFVTNDFEYVDFGGVTHNLSDYTPDLTPRSLVSPVPQPGQEKLFLEYLEKEAKKKKEAGGGRSPDKEVKVQPDEEANNTNENVMKSSERDKQSEVIVNSKSVKSETFKKRGIGSVYPSGKPSIAVSARNNPYPYGPKILPEHVLTYNSNLKPKQIPKTFGTLFPDKDFLYNYDDDEHEDSEEREETKEGNNIGEEGGGGEEKRDKKYFVKTEKPTVLFHFDKPGYSPKLPDGSLPPTRAPTPSDPWDCAPRCPRYSLLDWNQDYDIRQYPVTTWISTVIIAENRILAELEGYMRVQDYFYGLNDRGQLLNMTVPFVTQIKHGRHPGVLKEFTDFTVSLYVNHIDDPLNYDLPTPISNEVLIDRLETKTVFVAGFEANVWDVTETFLNEKASMLMEKLRQNGEAFLDRYFYLASYSRPELYQPVYYELWIYATSFRDTVISPPPIAPRSRPPPNKITTKSLSKLCRGVECPPFEVLRTYRYGIQKRRYFDGLFVTTSPGECEFTTLSVWKGFMPLHLYKHGINSHMEVIEATRPIGLIHIKEDSTSMTECPQNMTMAIYLPKRLHSNPPLTGYDAPSIHISALQDVVVYAYTVGGYLLEPDRVRKELSDLKHRLTEFGACFKKDEYYVVVYDFIIRYHGRQNEIWVVAENCKATLNG